MSNDGQSIIIVALIVLSAAYLLAAISNRLSPTSAVGVTAQVVSIIFACCSGGIIGATTINQWYGLAPQTSKPFAIEGLWLYMMAVAILGGVLLGTIAWVVTSSAKKKPVSPEAKLVNPERVEAE